MSKPTSGAAIVDHLTAPEGLHESIQEKSRHFARWRQAMAPLHPTDERLLLACLLDHEHWTYKTADTYVKSIDAYYRRTTGSALSGPVVKTYLGHKQRLAHHRLELVPALRLEDARDIAERTEWTVDPLGAALQAALVLLRSFTDLSRPLRECWASVHDVSITSGPTEPSLSMLDSLVPLDPAEVDEWRDHLAQLADREQVDTCTRTAAAHAGIDDSAPASSLTEDEWDGYWRSLGVSSYRLVRDRAYLLVGLQTARRHAELERLGLGDVRESAQGYTLTFWDDKRRVALVYDLPHHGRTDAPCPPDCAACALADLLAYERNVQNRSDGPVFATRYGGEYRAMTRQNARLRVRQLAGEEYSTRSLRAGAATSAWERGMPLPEIAATVTRHATLAEAKKYIRKTGAGGATLQLKLAPAID